MRGDDKQHSRQPDVTLRHAKRRDVPALREHAEDFFEYAQLGNFGFAFDFDTFRQFCYFLADRPNCCLILAESQEEIVGGVGGMVVPWFLNSKVKLIKTAICIFI